MPYPINYPYPLRSSILFFLPFFIVELLDCFELILNLIYGLCCTLHLKLCCSLIGTLSIKKMVSLNNLIFFVGKKDQTGRENVLCLESAKLFFGYGPQLCYQLWVLEATTSPKDSQYFSIVSSLLLSTKAAYELLTYTRSEPQQQQSNEREPWKEKLHALMWNAKDVFLDYLSWLPLILSSLIFKIGSINLYMKFFGWYSVSMFFLTIFLNVVGNFIISRMNAVTKNNRWTINAPQGEDKDFSWLDNLFISFTNMFVISRPLNTLRKLVSSNSF